MKTMLRLAVAAAVIAAVPARAQQPAFAPPDEQLWRQMSEAFSQLSMPMQTHQQVQQIMLNVEQQAQVRALQKAKEEPPPTPPPPPAKDPKKP